MTILTMTKITRTKKLFLTQFATRFYFWMICAMTLVTSVRAELTLESTILQTLKHSPELESNQYMELTRQLNERIAWSRYYPKISFEMLESHGFPGSAGATTVTGLMISPFRTGVSAGFFVEDDLWDFGRTTGAIRVAEHETNVSKKQGLVTALKISDVAQQAYYLCSKDRTLAELTKKLVREASLIEKEVSTFVRVGQTSVVEGVLSQSQNEEARTLAESYQIQYELDNKRLGLLTGQAANQPLCQSIDSMTYGSTHTQSSPPNAASSSKASPLLAQAEAQTAMYQAKRDLSLADFNPKLIGIGSVGYIQNTELGIKPQNYSVAVGLIWPIFEGFKTSSEVKMLEAQTAQAEKTRDATQFRIDDANLSFDRNIQANQVRVNHLKREFQLAENGFQLAKKRYLAHQGDLGDLRETFRNLTRISIELNESKYDLLTQIASQSLMNGHWNHLLSPPQKGGE